VLWKDDGIFPSSVRGLIINRRDLEIAVNFERAIGIDVIRPVDAKFVLNKRYADNNMAVREAALIDLSFDGRVLGQRDFSAGLSIYLAGLIAFQGKPIIYGSLGGEPAANLH
jgi:hypothetical protein